MHRDTDTDSADLSLRRLGDLKDFQVAEGDPRHSRVGRSHP